MSERTDRGRRPSVTDEEIIAIFETADEPVLTTAEVAEQLDIGTRATLNRLDTLLNDGILTSKNVGSGRVWWLAPDVSVPATDISDDPLFDLPTFSGDEPTDVSEHVDEHIAAAIAGEGEDADT